MKENASYVIKHQEHKSIIRIMPNHLRLFGFALLAIVIFMLTGCGSTSVYVLKQDEIVPLLKGENFTTPYDGCYYSLNAEKRVMDAKRIEVNTR